MEGDGGTTYTAALSTYALTLLEHPKANNSMKLLMKRATRNNVRNVNFNLNVNENSSARRRISVGVTFQFSLAAGSSLVGGQIQTVARIKHRNDGVRRAVVGEIRRRNEHGRGVKGGPLDVEAAQRGGWLHVHARHRARPGGAHQVRHRDVEQHHGSLGARDCRRGGPGVQDAQR